MNKLLYVSLNDGSDMRINKEVKTLSAHFDVDFVGVANDDTKAFVRPFVTEISLVAGERRQPKTLLKFVFLVAKKMLFTRYHSVHVINEQPLLLLYPFLFLQKHVVLDLFDSLFLMKNKVGNQMVWLKKMVYAPAHVLLVTDENRRTLLPDCFQKAAVVLPNYPYKLIDIPTKGRHKTLTIMYFGWLGSTRGTHTMEQLMLADDTVRVLMAGWCGDAASEKLSQHPNATWLGVLPQQEAMHTAAQRADYILCVYAPVEQNNINASPNKIYDAIQTRTPVIMNPEVRVHSFVKQNNLGYIMDQYEATDYKKMAEVLFNQRQSYQFDDALVAQFTWENVEGQLIIAHTYVSKS